MTLEWINEPMSVCRLADFSGAQLNQPYVFAERTPDECSLVCPTRLAPANAEKREDGWAMLRVVGTMEFSLVGVLAKLSGALAAANVGLFAVSTDDTDYILVKAENKERAEAALANAGCAWKSAAR